MKSRKILFANFPADGHFSPLTGLAIHLKNSGHDVRWYTGSKYEAKIKSLGFTYYPLKKAIDFSTGEPDQVFPERKNHKGQIAKLKFDIKHAFVLRGPEFYKDIAEINESFPFDIMIADNCFTGIPFVRQLLAKPVIAIGVMPLMETSRDLPPTGLGLTPSHTSFGKLKQDLMRFFADKFIFNDSKKLTDKIFSEYGMKKSRGNIFDIVSKEADLFLQSGTPGFEYRRTDLRNNIHFIGPLLPYGHEQDKNYQVPDQYKNFKKRILVTQGTVETDVDKIISPTLEAFKDTDVLVIATTGGSRTQELRDRYPHANILIEDFIPFNDIMPQVDAYVTNGGYGGVLLGIQNKIPMVVAGIHEGKNEINARIGYFKLGVDLKTEKPTPTQIRESVETILQNRLYRRNVIKLANEFEDYDPAWLTEKYADELISRQERSTRATFLRMIRKHAEEKVY
ncbi:MAG TPA: nucleotide disphospho-sugar-binding domain-containing protein [Chitinophagaceae bacterium]|jgi:UDP:flavonoid glycosyltransferase YjiC (YdhE family)|nr:nucleotide disphospho-sugar-binding domain-containing protein [Chitinophagaceae bacterium]